MDWRFCPRCSGPLVDRVIGGFPRRACADDACGFVHWDNPAPVVAALVEVGGRVLLARNRSWPEGQFGLVTGFLERGETPEVAVVREVKEETDLDAQGVTLIGVYPFARKNEVIIAYHVAATGAVRLNDELAEYRLVDRDRLAAWDYGTGFAVRDWLEQLRAQR